MKLKKMTEEKRTVKEFVEDLKKFSFDGDAVDVDVNLLLEAITQSLDGKLSHWHCITKNTEHRKIVIEYGTTRKER